VIKLNKVPDSTEQTVIENPVIAADNSDGASVGRKKKKKKLFKVKRTRIIPAGIEKELNSEIVTGA